MPYGRSLEYLQMPQFAGFYGGGGNRTRARGIQDMALLQEKRVLCERAYRLETDFVTAFKFAAWEASEHLVCGQETNVYFIVEAGEDGPFKIGQAGNPLERLSTLRNANPRQLILYAAVPGTTNLERFLHAKLGNDRLTGEWFRSTPRVRAIADLFLGVGQMTEDMLSTDGEVDSGTTLAHLTFEIEEAAIWLKEKQAAA